MTNQQVYVFPSPLGWFAIDWEAAELQALVFGYASAAEAAGALRAAPVAGSDRRRLGPTDIGFTDIQRNPRAVAREVRQLAERIRAYAGGGRDAFLDIPVAWGHVTEFQRRVLQQCRRIGYGQTITYGQLAAKAGSPHAARAVGTVMAGNRVPLVIPCHRVVGSGGALRGYSGCGGIAMKQRLLELEGAS